MQPIDTAKCMTYRTTKFCTVTKLGVRKTFLRGEAPAPQFMGPYHLSNSDKVDMRRCLLLLAILDLMSAIRTSKDV